MAVIDLGKVVPEKGVDYFTDAEVAQFKAEIESDIPTKVSQLENDSHFVNETQLATKEDANNKTGNLDENSTTTQFPNAKIVYDKLVEKQNEIDSLYDQIPTANVEGTTINVTDSSNLPLADIQLKGNASQTTTSIAGGDEYDSPTPDHPQPISVVTGDNTVTIVGENRLPNFTNETKSGVTITSNSPEVLFNGTNSGQVNGTNNWFTLPAGTYYINAKYVSGSLTDVVQIIFRKRGSSSDLTNISFNTTNYAEDKSVRFVLTQTTDIRAYVYCGSTERTFDQFKINIQVTQSNSPNYNFTPYQGSTQLISLGNIELAKIGDYEDYIYKSEGKWYKYGAVGKLVLDGTENDWVQESGNAPFKKPISDLLRNDNDVIVKSNYFIGVAYNGSWTSYDALVSVNNTNARGLKFRYTAMADLTAFKTWLGTHNTTVYYVLATPTITEITDTTLKGQLDNLLALKTNRTITNMFTVTNYEQPTLDVTYRQDLTTLFNNLTSAIVSLGNNT